MKTEHLREFAVLARHLNFTVAAKELFVAQSTLSAHMAQLEEELGFALFERKGEVRLTVAGSMFLEKATEALDLLDRRAAQCRALTGPAGGETPLRIALQAPPPRFANRLKESVDFPFRFVFHDYQDPFFSMFANDEADLLLNYDFRPFPALCHEAERLGLAARTVAGAPASITVSVGNPLASKDPLVRSDLRGATVVVNSAPDYERWKALVNAMLGEDLGVAFELDPVGDLNNLAFSDHGNRLHVCSRELNDQYLGRRGDVKVIESVEGLDLRIPQAAVWRADADATTLARIEACCRCWDETVGQEG